MAGRSPTASTSSLAASGSSIEPQPVPAAPVDRIPRYLRSRLGQPTNRSPGDKAGGFDPSRLACGRGWGWDWPPHPVPSSGGGERLRVRARRAHAASPSLAPSRCLCLRFRDRGPERRRSKTTGGSRGERHPPVTRSSGCPGEAETPRRTWWAGGCPRTHSTGELDSVLPRAPPSRGTGAQSARDSYRFTLPWRRSSRWAAGWRLVAGRLAPQMEQPFVRRWMELRRSRYSKGGKRFIPWDQPWGSDDA